MHRARAAWRAAPRHLVRCQATAAPLNLRPFCEVPGPKPLPLVGNAWRFLPIIGTFKTDDLMKWTSDLHATYGDIVKVSNVPGRRDLVFLFDPDHIETVFRNEGQWPKRFFLESVAHYRNKVRPDFFEGNPSIANENGARWQAARSAVNPVIMQPRAAAQFLARSDQVSRDFIHRLSELRDEKQETPADFINELRKWALESIALVTLDTRLGCLEKNLPRVSESQQMIDAVQVVFDGSFELDRKIPFWKMFPTSELRKFTKHSDTFLEIAIKHVEAARAAMSESTPEEEMSVLQKILRRDPSTKRAVVMVMDLITAGTDTTSSTAASVLYYLANNPQRQERLFQELRSLMPDSPETPLTADIMENMKYLRACIKEALRLSPVTVLNSRILNEQIVLNNFIIPAGVEFLMMNATLCRMEKHFPSPDQFLPERWLRAQEGACPRETPDKKTNPFVYLPFGHGPRKCVGMRFANIELETLVARVVQRFRLEWHHAAMHYEVKMLSAPASPLRLRVIDRP